ncbi:MAG: TatD family hydrolase [Polyangiaceae bacterium]|nr:TatD family hydrolase [Polyangiaceae bacterium]
MLLDTHCHLEAGRFPEGADEVLARARAAGVAGCVVIGVGADLAPAAEAVALATRCPELRAAVGMHPHDAAALDEPLYAELARLARAPEVVAIGEIGLDHHYLLSPAPVQETVFRRFVALAREVDKPVVVHTRLAPALTLEVLASARASEVGGVIHCFSEDVAFARRALDLGFDLSFSGLVTFKKAHAVQEAARFCPADRLLVETDSPYLAPVPLRGKRCEPAFVVHTARFLATLRGESFDELSERTTANARRRFRAAALGAVAPS